MSCHVYEQITNRIIALLEQGAAPWHKPWNARMDMPRNLLTKRAYRGINVFLLLAMDYESPYWLTFRQAIQLGGTVKKGERSCPVVFWKHTEIEDEQTGEKREIPLLRYYRVFNTAQCEGIGDSLSAARSAPGQRFSVPNRTLSWLVCPSRQPLSTDSPAHPILRQKTWLQCLHGNGSTRVKLFTPRCSTK